MFPTGDFDRLKYDILERYCDIDIPITFGILIADYDQSVARQYIINYLELFNEKSGKFIDFFIPGYSNSAYRNGKKIYLASSENEYYFSRNLFHEFIKKFEETFKIEYTYNPVLILIELKDKDFINSNKIVIELDAGPSDIRRTGQLFNNIFKIAKSEVSLQKISNYLTTTYIKGALLESFVRLLDNKYITEVNTYYKNTRCFRIK